MRFGSTGCRLQKLQSSSSRTMSLLQPLRILGCLIGVLGRIPMVTSSVPLGLPTPLKVQCPIQPPWQPSRLSYASHFSLRFSLLWLLFFVTIDSGRPPMAHPGCGFSREVPGPVATPPPTRTSRTNPSRSYGDPSSNRALKTATDTLTTGQPGPPRSGPLQWTPKMRMTQKGSGQAPLITSLTPATSPQQRFGLLLMLPSRRASLRSGGALGHLGFDGVWCEIWNLRKRKRRRLLY
mmetsp:Transcript_6115/g.17869  ORF Transcript_6115/g.17869 Transcript_6115/m.17869 type:complete len:236 (+) Transcript_6115:8-715(+)